MFNRIMAFIIDSLQDLIGCYSYSPLTQTAIKKDITDSEEIFKIKLTEGSEIEYNLIEYQKSEFVIVIEPFLKNY